MIQSLRVQIVKKMGSNLMKKYYILNLCSFIDPLIQFYEDHLKFVLLDKTISFVWQYEIISF